MDYLNSNSKCVYLQCRTKISLENLVGPTPGMEYSEKERKMEWIPGLTKYCKCLEDEPCVAMPTITVPSSTLNIIFVVSI